MRDALDYLDAETPERPTLPHVPVPVRPAHERTHDFAPAILGYTLEQARREASRCARCVSPQGCLTACPLHNNVPEMMQRLEQGDVAGAARAMRLTTTMPEICGRVCPHLCQANCYQGKRGEPAAIGALETFVADYQRRAEGGYPLPARQPGTGKRLAVVGAGPAGLTVAEPAACAGHTVTVYEAMPAAGGILVYGIPSFKLDKALVAEKVDMLRRLGVSFRFGVCVGRDVTIDRLLQAGEQAVFVGSGAARPLPLGIPGEDLPGVLDGLTFLLRANLPAALLPPGLSPLRNIGGRVAVIGGGDTATDCARSAVRLGAQEVAIVYRRSERDMPGNKEDRAFALEEGVRLELLAAPLRFIEQAGRLSGLECLRMKPGPRDASGRRQPVPVEGSEFVLELDTVIVAAGHGPDALPGTTTPGLALRDGLIVVDEGSGRTSRPGVFAAGDAVHGPDLVVTAMAGARAAAQGINEYLSTLP